MRHRCQWSCRRARRRAVGGVCRGRFCSMRQALFLELRECAIAGGVSLARLACVTKTKLHRSSTIARK
jgi:hypothetical protein